MKQAGREPLTPPPPPPQTTLPTVKSPTTTPTSASAASDAAASDGQAVQTALPLFEESIHRSPAMASLLLCCLCSLGVGLAGCGRALLL